MFWYSGAAITGPNEPLPLTDYGRIAEEAIQTIAEKYSYVSVDKYVVMPNHVHMIIRISDHEEPEPGLMYNCMPLRYR